MRPVLTGVGEIRVREFPGDGPPLLMLHGFTQTHESVAEVAGTYPGPVMAPDLPFHGSSAAIERGWADAVDEIAAVAARLGPFAALCGYSMGGRLALGVTVEHPELVSRLIVVSASPGIEDERAREARRHADCVAARRIEAEGIESFIDRWLAGEIQQGLSSRSDQWRETDRSIRLQNTAAGLAAALRLLGTGHQPSYWEALADIAIPALIIAGEHDDAYTATGRRMAAALPSSEFVIAPDCGHALMGERPDWLATVIADFVTG